MPADRRLGLKHCKLAVSVADEAVDGEQRRVAGITENAVDRCVAQVAPHDDDKVAEHRELRDFIRPDRTRRPVNENRVGIGPFQDRQQLVLVIERKSRKFVVVELFEDGAKPLGAPLALLARPVRIEVDDFPAGTAGAHEDSAARTPFDDPLALHALKRRVYDTPARVETVDDMPDGMKPRTRRKTPHLGAQPAVQFFRLFQSFHFNAAFLSFCQ